MNSTQDFLFYESVEQAIDAVVNACGGRKKFACEMWPDKPQRDAHNLLDACLNPERREKFSPAQMLYIMKRGKDAGCHAVARYMGLETGYEFTPITPEAERDRLADAILEASRTLQRALKSAEGIPVRRVA